MAASVDDRQLRMAALQDWYEGGTPSFPKLAAASGIHITWIKEYAATHNWKKRSNGRPKLPKSSAEVPAVAGVDAEDYAAVDAQAAPEVRLKRVMDAMLREVEAIGIAARRQGLMPDKARIDAVWSMVRMLEKVEEFARERAGGIQAKRDEEMGDVLARIDGRIEELARAYAEELVRASGGEMDGAHMQKLDGGEPERGGGAADPGRMAAERAA